MANIYKLDIKDKYFYFSIQKKIREVKLQQTWSLNALIATLKRAYDIKIDKNSNIWKRVYLCVCPTCKIELRVHLLPFI